MLEREPHGRGSLSFCPHPPNSHGDTPPNTTNVPKDSILRDIHFRRFSEASRQCPHPHGTPPESISLLLGVLFVILAVQGTQRLRQLHGVPGVADRLKRRPTTEMAASRTAGCTKRRALLGCGVAQRGDIQGVELRIIQNVRQRNLLRNRGGSLLSRRAHRGIITQSRTDRRLIRTHCLRSLLNRRALLRSGNRTRGRELGRHVRLRFSSGGRPMHSHLLRGFDPRSNTRGLLRCRLLSGLHGRDGLSCHYLFTRRLGLSSTGCRLRGRATTALLIEEHTTAANGLESA